MFSLFLFPVLLAILFARPFVFFVFQFRDFQQRPDEVVDFRQESTQEHAALAFRSVANAGRKWEMTLEEADSLPCCLRRQFRDNSSRQDERQSSCVAQPPVYVPAVSMG